MTVQDLDPDGVFLQETFQRSKFELVESSPFLFLIVVNQIPLFTKGEVNSLLQTDEYI